MGDRLRAEDKFAVMPEYVLNLPLSDRAIRLYAVLARYADKDDHTSYPSRKTLADRMRCSIPSVDRAAKELVNAGLLRKEYRWQVDEDDKRKQTSNLWTLLSRPGVTGEAPRASRVKPPGRQKQHTELEPLEREPVELSIRKQTRAVKVAVGEDWRPKEETIQRLKGKYPKLNLENQLGQFLDWHISKGNTFADWDAAFRNWMRIADTKRREREGVSEDGFR